MGTRTSDSDQTRSRLRPAKHAAIMAGSREVFSRQGFARANIDAIATTAGVSTRTIYKHFRDKSALFAAVVADSSAQVAEQETALIERHLSGVTTRDEVEPALLAFARDWIASAPQGDDHRALIRQVHSEAAHLGEEVVGRWWESGPGRVIATLAEVMTSWSVDGLLLVDDGERAATHFTQLVAAEPGPPGARTGARTREEWLSAGVHTFVRAYAP